MGILEAMPDLYTFDYIDALANCLSMIGDETMTSAQFERRLKDALLAREKGQEFHPPEVHTADPQGLFLGNHELNETFRVLERIEAAPLRETAAYLAAVIRRREEQDDLWPDGRLELGITYAALGEFRRASETLDEVVQICRSGGRYQKSEMAMAV